MPNSDTTTTSSLGQSKKRPAYWLLTHDQRFNDALRQHQIIFFLDFDGTLAPIVKQPTEAVIPARTQQLIRALGDRYPVFAISGRMREDLQRRIGLDNVGYIGCHGLDVEEEYRSFLPPAVREAPAHMNNVKPALARLVSAYPGAFLEDKHYTLAVHYRQINQVQAPELERGLRAIMAQHPRLTIQEAKKVFEIIPQEHWDKGKIVALLHQQDKWRNHLPLYIGDDLPDEPAFLAVADGASILVGDNTVATNAHYELPDPEAVADFISSLLQLSQEMA